MSHHSKPGAANHQKSNSKVDKSSPPEKCLFVRPQVQAVRIETSSDETERYSDEKDDRKKQLVLASKLNRITAVGAGISVFALFALFLSLYYTRDQFREEQRPWLALAANQVPQARVEPTASGAAFSAEIPFMNFGKSPAVHVFRAFNILVPEKLENDPESGWKEIQSKGDAWFKEMGMPLKKTVPETGGLYTLANGIAVPEETVMPTAPYPFGAIQDKNFDALPHYPAMIVARVEYHDGAGSLYWTDICYVIGKQLGTDGKQTGIVVSPCPTHNEIH